MQSYLILGINPEPWTPSRTVRSGQTFKPAYLDNYQRAIKDALVGAPRADHDRIDLAFYFWRTAGTKHDHRADATNLQKALEDALQGVIFENDRNVVHVSTWVIEQEPTTESMILIEADEAGTNMLADPSYAILTDLRADGAYIVGEPTDTDPDTEDFEPQELF